MQKSKQDEPNNDPLSFDQEPIYITKNELCNMLDSLASVWTQRGIIKNAKHIAALKAFKIALWWLSEEDFKMSIQLVIKFIDVMRYENHKLGVELDAKTFSQIKNDFINNPLKLSELIFG